MQRVIKAEAELPWLELGRITAFFPSGNRAAERRLASPRAFTSAISGLGLLAAFAFAAPVQAQGLSLIESAQASVAAPRAPAGACDDTMPECQAAKKALAAGLRAQRVAVNAAAWYPAPFRAPDAAAAFGGLAGKASAPPAPPTAPSALA